MSAKTQMHQDTAKRLPACIMSAVSDRIRSYTVYTELHAICMRITELTQLPSGGILLAYKTLYVFTGMRAFGSLVQIVHSRTLGTAAAGGGIGTRVLLPAVDMLNHGGDQYAGLRDAPCAAADCARQVASYCSSSTPDSSRMSGLYRSPSASTSKHLSTIRHPHVYHLLVPF
jgi:hypothetical protein